MISSVVMSDSSARNDGTSSVRLSALTLRQAVTGVKAMKKPRERHAARGGQFGAPQPRLPSRPASTPLATAHRCSRSDTSLSKGASARYAMTDSSAGCHRDASALPTGASGRVWVEWKHGERA